MIAHTGSQEKSPNNNLPGALSCDSSLTTGFASLGLPVVNHSTILTFVNTSLSSENLTTLCARENGLYISEIYRERSYI